MDGKIREDRAVGMMLGGACGDMLGIPLETQTRKYIIATYGSIDKYVTEFLTTDSQKNYTDDTQMSLGTALSLIKNKTACPFKFTDEYISLILEDLKTTNGRDIRGYGSGTFNRLLGYVYRDGGSPLKSGHDGQPSPNNGSVMRIAPIGFVYSKNTDLLRDACWNSILSTHATQFALDSCLVYTMLIAHLCEMTPSETSNKKLQEPISLAYKHKLITKLLKHSSAKKLSQKLELIFENLQENITDDKFYKVAELLKEDYFGLHSTSATAVVIWTFLCYIDNPILSALKAIDMGGDTDTFCSLVCSLQGALHGSSWIPEKWIEKLENGKYGKDFIIETAKHLASAEMSGIVESYLGTVEQYDGPFGETVPPIPGVKFPQNILNI